MKKIIYIILLFYCFTAQAQTVKRLPYVLTISGNISLGNYQAGLNWTIVEILRNFSWDPQVKEDISLVTITGASSGSINTLLTAIRYCEQPQDVNTADSNFLKSTWADIGFDVLIPRNAESYDVLPSATSGNKVLKDGLLSRKAFIKVINHLKQRVAKGKFRSDCSLDSIAVTVTRNQSRITNFYESLDIATQRFTIPLKMEIKQGKLLFRNYVIKDKKAFNHIYLPENAEGFVDFKHVVQSVLASSAFPIAFGRVPLDYCAARYNLSTEELSQQSKHRCPTGTRAESGDFVDGGVFDNVPLGASRLLAEHGKLCQDRENPTCRNSRYNYIYIDPNNRRRHLQANGKLHKDEDDYAKGSTFGIYDQSLFLTDAVSIAQNNELYFTLQSYDWFKHRKLLLTTRYGPLTGKYLSHFGAFLDPLYREFDYYSGIYDGVVNIATYMCYLHRKGQLHMPSLEPKCSIGKAAQQLFTQLKLQQSTNTKIIFQTLAGLEYRNDQDWAWTQKLHAPSAQKKHVLYNLFVAMSGDGKKILLEDKTPFVAQRNLHSFLGRLDDKHFGEHTRKMIRNPHAWFHSYAGRFSRRMLQLELNAEKARKKRALRIRTFVPITKFSKLAVNTLYHGRHSAFPESSAENNLPWHYSLVPHEFSMGSETDVILIYRKGLYFKHFYFEGEIAPIHKVLDGEREDFAHIGINFRHRRPSMFFSSFGIGAKYFKNYASNPLLDRETMAYETNFGFFADKVRLVIAKKDTEETILNQDWYFSLGISDFKGLYYWFINYPR